MSMRRRSFSRAFTLQEILVVLIILGILSTLGYTQYSGIKGKALEKEAEANLRLILAAEKIYRMEDADGVHYTDCSNNECVNEWLKTELDEGGSPTWVYSTDLSTGKATATRPGKKCTMNIGDTTASCVSN